MEAFFGTPGVSRNNLPCWRSANELAGVRYAGRVLNWMEKYIEVYWEGNQGMADTVTARGFCELHGGRQNITDNNASCAAGVVPPVAYSVQQLGVGSKCEWKVLRGRS